MVRFNEASFTVEVKTGSNPAELWLKTIDDMIDMLQSEDEDFQTNRHNYLELIRSMMPDVETAKKMCETQKNSTSEQDRTTKDLRKHRIGA